MTYSGSPNSYFKQLPNLDYPSLANDRNSAYDYQIVKNIFKRAVLRDDVFDEVTAFTKYSVLGNERPDQVAAKFYNDPALDWVILTTNNEIIEYDLIDNILTKENVREYFKNIDVNIDNLLFMNSKFYIFSEDKVFIFDKNINKTISKNNIKKIFKNAPLDFSSVFLNNNILYENIPYGSPCFFRNKDLFIYDLKKNDTYFTNIDNGLIKNTNYNIIKYTGPMLHYTTLRIPV